MLRFNFAETKESTYSKYLKPDLIFFFLIILSVIIGTYLYTATLKQEIKNAQLQIDSLNREIRRLHQIQRTEKELISRKKELQRKLEVVSLLDKRRKVPAFLYFFADPNNVKDIWIDSLNYSGNQLQLTGGTFNIKKFPYFLKILEENLGNILFRKTFRQTYENRELNYKVVYYKFNFGLELKNGTAH